MDTRDMTDGKKCGRQGGTGSIIVRIAVNDVDAHVHATPRAIVAATPKTSRHANVRNGDGT